MDELKKKLEELLEAHTKKAVVSCDENCMCWEIESLLCDLDMQAEKAAQQNAHLTGGGLCAQCGSPAWTHSVRDHAFVEPHHPQVA